MQKADKGWLMIRIGRSGRMFLLVGLPAHPGSPGQMAIKWLCVRVCGVCVNLQLNLKPSEL